MASHFPVPRCCQVLDTQPGSVFHMLSCPFLLKHRGVVTSPSRGSITFQHPLFLVPDSCMSSALPPVFCPGGTSCTVHSAIESQVHLHCLPCWLPDLSTRSSSAWPICVSVLLSTLLLSCVVHCHFQRTRERIRIRESLEIRGSSHTRKKCIKIVTLPSINNLIKKSYLDSVFS